MWIHYAGALCTLHYLELDTSLLITLLSLSHCWQILYLLSPVSFRISVGYLVISAWHYAAHIMLSNNAGCICKMWTYYFLFTNVCPLKSEKYTHVKSGSFNYYILIHNLIIWFSNTLPNTVCINYQKISLFIKFLYFFILVNYSISFIHYISFSQQSLAFKYLHKHRMLNVELKKEIKGKCNNSQLHH